MDIEKTMQSILETKAKREVAIQQADERFAHLREQTEERFRSLVDVTVSLARHGEETDQRFRETDYKLNAFIDAVGKLVKRNGSR